MRSTSTLALVLVAIVYALPASAQRVVDQPIEVYVARLGPADHFNSKGQRLSSAAAIIRQDRANYHRFGVRDPEEEPVEAVA